MAGINYMEMVFNSKTTIKDDVYNTLASSNLGIALPDWSKVGVSFDHG